MCPPPTARCWTGDWASSPTGPGRSVLGMKHEQAVNRFLGGLPMRFEPAPGPCKLEAVLFSLDTETRRCVHVERVDIAE